MTADAEIAEGTATIAAEWEGPIARGRSGQVGTLQHAQLHAAVGCGGKHAKEYTGSDVAGDLVTILGCLPLTPLATTSPARSIACGLDGAHGLLAQNLATAESSSVLE